MPIMEKRASWLELFYDVAFIALVAQLTYLAATHHHTLSDWLHIGIIGYTIFIAWWATTANRNLQPSETHTDKFLIQVQMVGVFLMSLTMQQVFDGLYLWFFLTLALVRALQAFMILRMYSLHPETRPVTYNLLAGFFVASLLWAASAFLPAPYHFVVAGLALATDILVPLTKGEGNVKRYLNVHHLQERLGLFLMLVIGESMIVVALANSVSAAVFSQLGVVCSGLVLMIALWWLYFEHSDQHAGTRPRELFTFLHAHGGLFSGIMLVSVGYKLLLEGQVSSVAFTCVVGGMAAITLGLLAVRRSLHALRAWVCAKIAGLLLVAVLVAVAGYLSGQYLTATALLTALFAVAAVVDEQAGF